MTVLKVGELARATGLTVRTLHHYDQIGLLEPAERSYTGYRLYREADVTRLYRIVALRRLGLPLAEIATALEDEGGDPRESIRRHLQELEREIGLQQQLRERLVAILAALETADEPSVDDYVEAIERMTMIEKHYTPEQVDWLARRRGELDEAAIEDVQEEWPRLMESVKDLMDAGADPASPEVQVLAARWRELLELFHGGRADVEQSLDGAWREASEEQRSEWSGGTATPELFEFVARANAAAESA